jgi:GT2 family glycosyltransferase
MFYPIRVPLISVVIPNYTMRGILLLDKCLRSLAYSHGHLQPHMEIIVVEDSEDQGVPEAVDRIARANELKVQFVSQPNGGFARACNRGIEMSSGQVVFLVNNDIEFIGPTLQILSDSILSTKAGVIGCRLIYPDYSIQHAGVLFVPHESEVGPGYFDHFLRHQEIGRASCRERVSLHV